MIANNNFSISLCQKPNFQETFKAHCLFIQEPEQEREAAQRMWKRCNGGGQ